MKNRVKMLKVKIKSLAAEARIIRLEERLALGARLHDGADGLPVYRGRDAKLHSELHEHRVRDVRQEQRSSLLAYAFLRGVPLAACEAKCKVPPDWKRVGQIVEKFGVLYGGKEKAEQAERLAGWKAGVAPVAA